MALSCHVGPEGRLPPFASRELLRLGVGCASRSSRRRSPAMSTIPLTAFPVRRSLPSQRWPESRIKPTQFGSRRQPRSICRAAAGKSIDLLAAPYAKRQD